MEDDPVIGITFGAFDLLHAGHSHFLMRCASRCDELIVGLHTDPSIERAFKNKPVQSTFERHAQLCAHRGVSAVIPYDTEQDLRNMLGMYNANIYFLGSDYKGKQLPEEVIRICSERGISLCYIDRCYNYSSSELRERVTKANAQSKNNNGPSGRVRKS